MSEFTELRDMYLRNESGRLVVDEIHAIATIEQQIRSMVEHVDEDGNADIFLHCLANLASLCQVCAEGLQITDIEERSEGQDYKDMEIKKLKDAIFNLLRKMHTDKVDAPSLVRGEPRHYWSYGEADVDELEGLL